MSMSATIHDNGSLHVQAKEVGSEEVPPHFCVLVIERFMRLEDGHGNVEGVHVYFEKFEDMMPIALEILRMNAINMADVDTGMPHA